MEEDGETAAKPPSAATFQEQQQVDQETQQEEKREAKVNGATQAEEERGGASTTPPGGSSEEVLPPALDRKDGLRKVANGVPLAQECGGGEDPMPGSTAADLPMVAPSGFQGEVVVQEQEEQQPGPSEQESGEGKVPMVITEEVAEAASQPEQNGNHDASAVAEEERMVEAGGEEEGETGEVVEPQPGDGEAVPSQEAREEDGEVGSAAMETSLEGGEGEEGEIVMEPSPFQSQPLERGTEVFVGGEWL